MRSGRLQSVAFSLVADYGVGVQTTSCLNIDTSAALP